MSFKKRALSALLALTFIFGSIGNVAVYAVAEDEHTHEHTTFADTSDSSDTTDKEDPPTSHTHTWDSGTVTKQPTCTEKGKKTYQCTKCSETKTEDIPAKGHTEKTERTEPTCGKAGEIKTVCTVCGNVIKTTPLPATGNHQWDNGVWIGSSDCQTPGDKKFTCSVCKQEKIEKRIGDHKWSNWVVKDAKCEEDGVKVRSCTVAGCHEQQKETIKATGHKWKEATCTSPKTCSACGKTEGEALGHDWDKANGKITKNPTCTEGGETTYSCKRCNATHTLKNIEPLGHDFGAWKVTNPTCTQAGKKERTCSRCKGVEKEIIEATGHKVSDWQVKEEATCTKAGIKHKVCLICGKELESTNYELNPKGHTWSEWTVTKEPTYNTPGEKERHCTRKNCNAKETLRLPTIAKDHTHKFNGKTSVIKKPTCTEDGLNRVYCSHKGCNEYEEIITNSLGHAFDDWETTQEADCINTGLRMSECSRCGATQSETTPPLGHQYGEWIVTRESSDTESGIRQRTCEICGDIQIETFLGTPEDVDVNATLPNGTHGVTLTAPNEKNISDEERKSKNIKKAVGVTVITAVLAAVTAGAAFFITKKKKN